jgi:hypothetical protein
MSLTPTFQGEVQMRRWSDSSTQGVQVTFALADSEDLEPLKAKAGKRFMAVLVEIGDDEMPVAGNPVSEKAKVGPLCREAVDLCRMPEFQEWVAADDEIPTEHGAKSYMLGVCDVSSRRHLDEIPSAADRFISNIRIPFMRYMKERKAQ